MTVFVVLLLILVVQLLAGYRERLSKQTFPPSGQIIDVDGTPIHLHVTGSGPDVVLIHGASGSLRDFTFDLAGKLSTEFRVIAVDRPGHGWSGRPAGYGGVFNTAAESPQLQAQLLARAVRAVGAEKPIVVGHSYGGAVALAWALDAPEQTDALVLLGAASMPWPGTLDQFYRVNATTLGGAWLIPLLTAFVPRSYIEHSVSGIFAPQSAPEGYLAHFGPLRSLSRPAMRANAQQVNSLRPHIVEMSKRYPELTLPVEIVHGTEDMTVPLRIHSEPASQILPNAVLTRLDGIGHMPQHAAPAETVEAIRRAATRADLR
ncbi:MAG: alpha/beta fold hydrolase [Roseobacter sp.]